MAIVKIRYIGPDCTYDFGPVTFGDVLETEDNRLIQHPHWEQVSKAKKTVIPEPEITDDKGEISQQ